MSARRRTPLGWPVLALSALALGVAGPVASVVLVDLAIPVRNCGTWGLTCVFYKAIGSLASWGLGMALAIRGASRGETPWAVVPGLLLNALPLLYAVLWILHVVFR